MKMFDNRLPRTERLAAARESLYASGNSPDPDILKHLNGEVFKKWREASGRTAPGDWLAGGSAPMLVVQCLSDRMAPPLNSWNLVMRRPNARLMAIPNCGHAMIPEQPEAISTSVIAFLSEARR